MARVVLADSGALVAALDRRDEHHAWARAHFEAFRQPCFTCDAVLSESFFLLGGLNAGKETLCTALEREAVRLDFNTPKNLPDIIRLMRRYADTPMSFADACLVRMAELHADVAIFTVDSDFRIYRRNGRHIIPVIAPW